MHVVQTECVLLVLANHGGTSQVRSLLGGSVGETTQAIRLTPVQLTSEVESRYGPGTAGILPFRFPRKTEGINELTITLLLLSILVKRSPGTESLSLLPIHTNHRVIPVSLMPEIIIVHRLIV